MKMKNWEIKIETLCDHEHSGISMVVHATLDKEEDIIKKIINLFIDNDMGIKYVSFK